MKSLLALMLFGMPSLAMRQTTSNSSLFKAIKKNSPEKVFELLMEKLSTREAYKSLPILLEYQLYPQRKTALLEATINDNKDIARLLVAAGADIFSSDLTGVNSFYRALSHGQIDMLKIFMQTPIRSQRNRIENSLLDNLRFAPTYIPPTKNLFGLIRYFFELDYIETYKCKWLAELAKASEKTVLTNNNARQEYIRLAPIYKIVGLFISKQHVNRRESLIKRFMAPNSSSRNYWDLLPIELRSLTLDFLLNESQKVQQYQLNIIEQMPER